MFVSFDGLEYIQLGLLVISIVGLLVNFLYTLQFLNLTLIFKFALNATTLIFKFALNATISELNSVQNAINATTLIFKFAFLHVFIFLSFLCFLFFAIFRFLRFFDFCDFSNIYYFCDFSIF